MTTPFTLSIKGAKQTVVHGTSLAAAAANAGVCATRTSVTGQPRGPLCGMGVCYECRSTINQHPHQRSCMNAAGDGVDHRADSSNVPPATAHRCEEAACDVLVIGAGPAGLAAAREAALRGRSVIIIDDNHAPGGQIWRRDLRAPQPSRHETAARSAGASFLLDRGVVTRLDNGTILAASADGQTTTTIACRAIVLATGASERFLPFPGWTLPGIFGAGGIQALCKQGLDVAGKRIVIAGSGPLLLAVGALLAARGAEVAAIHEQASWSSVRSIIPALLSRPSKAFQALTARLRLLGTPYKTGWWPVLARGEDRVRELVLTDGRREEVIACDYAACGFGLLPRIRTGALLGCDIQQRAIRADSLQCTSIRTIYAAGECTGIGGVGKALVEGRIAGAAAAGDSSLAHSLSNQRQSELDFARLLDQAFPLREQLRAMPDDQTIICRCEDVRLGDLSHCHSWRDAKLHTRLGMGPCQGTVCGPIVEYLRGWRPADARAPIMNVSLGTLLEPGHHQPASPSGSPTQGSTTA
jgi:NADPH-dependent 2,4-dienoyl-CoA reductase/sulfur reductase-like enzyme